MAGSILEIKKKIQAIGNTMKITRAMQLVATSRMKSFQRTAVNLRGFALDLSQKWHHYFGDSQDNIYTRTKPDEATSTVFVLYSSDKGLCGGLNQQLAKTLLTSNLWLNSKPEDRIVVAIGKKGANYLKFRGIPVATELNYLPDNLTPLEALPVIDILLNLWQKETVKSIQMVAPHYKNSLVFYPIVKQFLPLSSSLLAAHSTVDSTVSEGLPRMANQFYIEPDRNSVTENMLKVVIHSLFLEAFYELKASEYSSRMLAMQNATNSAEKIITERTKALNQIRQEKITQEISEITGAQAVIV